MDKKESRRKASTKWRTNHPEYGIKYYQIHKEEKKLREQKLKTEVLTHYGNGKLECVLCHFDNVVALSIDHTDGNGSQHRKALKPFARSLGGAWFYRWLIKNNFPEGYRTLCMNCQWIEKERLKR
jgi:hypothetical protein